MCRQKEPTQDEIDAELDEWFKAGYEGTHETEPRAYFENDIEQVKRAYNWFLNGVLPEPGGWLDQDASLMRDIQLMKAIDSDRHQKWVKWKQKEREGQGKNPVTKIDL